MMKSGPSPPWLTLVAVVAALVGLAAWPNVGRADSISFTLSTGNSAISGSPGPYGTITVSLTDSTHATVTYTGNTVTTGTGMNQHTFVYKAGDGGTVAVNVNGTATVGTFVPSSLSNGGAGQEDGFGNFSNSVNNTDGAADALSSASFVLTATGTTTWSSAANVLTGNNAGGLEVAAHIFVFEDGSTSALSTGFASTGAVPEFGSATLMGLMLVGFGGIVGLRRFRKPALA